MTPNEILNYLSLWIPIIGGLGAFIIPFLYSMIKDAKTRRIEAQKPHLERQLELYTETCKIAVCLATTTDENEKSIAEKRFWELYWGELCMVENKEVEIQMKEFGNKLKIKVDQKELKDASYDLAHALRRSLESSWGIRVGRLLPY